MAKKTQQPTNPASVSNNPASATNPAESSGEAYTTTYESALAEQTDPASRGVGGILGSTSTSKTTTTVQKSQQSLEKIQKGLSGVQANPRCTDSDFFTVTRSPDAGTSTSGEGFSFQTYTSPKAPSNTSQANPPKNTASTTSLERGMTCGTNIGLANSRLSFECNFVAGIQLDTCVFKLKKQMDAYISMAAELVWSKIEELFPSGAHIKSFIDGICQWFNTINKMMCMIQQIISCIMSTINGILAIVSWATSLPARFLVMIMQCITNFFSSITGALGDLTSSLSTVLGHLGCKTDTCKPVTSIYDIGDTGSSIYNDFTK